ncbi:MAG TPA: hypothetical protein VFL66_05595, partial [Gaiellaceae bacterium]|nr:hypothetical protein [Gaiellaceae bacterium]
MRSAKLLSLAAVSALALVLAGCGGGEARVSKVEAPAKPKACTHLASWQKLANKIDAAVYCPNWLPDPLIPQIGGRWNNIDSVSKDRSYLESFVWQDTDGPNLSGELHINLRGYPGRTTIPTCHDVLFGGGKPKNIEVPCFSD